MGQERIGFWGAEVIRSSGAQVACGIGGWPSFIGKEGFMGIGKGNLGAKGFERLV